MFRKNHLLLSAALLSLMSLGSGCVGPKQEVVTFWNKMGIPQTHIFLRDHFTNRKGNNPQCERKPPLLRIADMANLESPSKAVQAAAKIKQEEDLAPQKIKALKYLAVAGCGCYDENGQVKDALLQALKDCTPAVRLAAIQTIEATLAYCEDVTCEPTGGCNACGGFGCRACVSEKRAQRQKDKELEKLQKTDKPSRICHRCSGKGCVCCDGCDTCGSCGCNSKGCCDKEVQAQLKEMAFGTDDSGCFKEPVAEIRAAAGRLLAQCPPIPEDVDPELEDIDPETGRRRNQAQEPVPQNNGASIRVITPEQARQNNASRQPLAGSPSMFGVSSRRGPEVAPVQTAAAEDDMMVASIEAFDRTSSQISLTFANDIMIPSGEYLLVETNKGTAHCRVMHSTPGRLYAQVVESNLPTAPMSGELIRFGVLAQ